MIWNSSDHFPPIMHDPSDAEFERDREALAAALDTLEGWDTAANDDPDSDARFAAMDFVTRFYKKHRARLEASGLSVAEFVKDFVAQKIAVEEALENEEKAIEAALHAKADAAEAHAKFVESQYMILRFYESHTEADWPTQTPAQQAEMRDLIDRLRESMPDLLASLPIEKRRELEQLE